MLEWCWVGSGAEQRLLLGGQSAHGRWGRLPTRRGSFSRPAHGVRSCSWAVPRAPPGAVASSEPPTQGLSCPVPRAPVGQWSRLLLRLPHPRRLPLSGLRAGVGTLPCGFGGAAGERCLRHRVRPFLMECNLAAHSPFRPSLPGGGGCIITNSPHRSPEGSWLPQGLSVGKWPWGVTLPSAAWVSIFGSLLQRSAPPSLLHRHCALCAQSSGIQSTGVACWKGWHDQ